MGVKIVVNQATGFNTTKVEALIQDFNTQGELIGDGSRNVIKILDVNGLLVNVKSFKIPNLVNTIVYRFFRKSKAQRSFEYASKLVALGFKTPTPIAYAEYTTAFTFKQSYYISQQLDCDLTFRELIHNPDLPDYEAILRAFTKFTFDLHEQGINFLDHSPGNTLIKRTADGYEFYLVDLNRMNFETMTFDKRMNNFARLSPRDHMLEVMVDEYAKHYTRESKDAIKTKMFFYSHKFMNSFAKREAFKRKYYFWRNKK